MSLIEDWKSIIPDAEKSWQDMCKLIEADGATQIMLWPGNKNAPPGDFRQHLKTPLLHIYSLKKTITKFVLIIPGGAFLFKSFHEALPVADAFKKKGYNVAILDYRCRPFGNGDISADGMRGIQVLRKYAKDQGIPDAKVITVGFSAGGILTSLININAEKGYEGIDDEISDIPILPDAEVMIYGAFTDTGITEHPSRSPERLCGFKAEEAKKDADESLLLRLPMELPPLFMAQTDDDDPLFILEMGRAWRMRGVPFEMHLFHGGSHGGGLYNGKFNAEKNDHAAHWFELCCEWIDQL